MHRQIHFLFDLIGSNHFPFIYLLIYLLSTRRKDLVWSLMSGNVVTFTRILPFRLWGLGSCLASPVSTDDRSSLSWNIPFRYWAIFLCCWILQWFSIDSITGNLRKQRFQGHSVQPALRDWGTLETESACMAFLKSQPPNGQYWWIMSKMLKEERLRIHWKKKKFLKANTSCQVPRVNKY